MPLIYLTAEELAEWRGFGDLSRGYLRAAAMSEWLENKEAAGRYRAMAERWREAADSLGTPGPPPEREGGEA